MAKELNADEEPSKKKLEVKYIVKRTGPGYKKRRLGLLSDEVKSEDFTNEKEDKISKSSGFIKRRLGLLSDEVESEDFTNKKEDKGSKSSGL